MRIKVITTTSDLTKCYQLERSLKYYGYDYHIILHEWKGFLSKLSETYEYLKTLKGYTHFLYSDAWDTIALAAPDELYSKMPSKGLLLSAERACYPDREIAKYYPANKSPWHFVNGGGWCGEISEFIRIYEEVTPKDELNDQAYLTQLFLSQYKDKAITLDYECSIFQTMAFNPSTDFTYKNNRVQNRITKTLPIFVHGNGHTDISHIYKLLPTNMDTIEQASSQWADTAENHKMINETFTDMVNKTPKLKALRDYVESTAYGFGERSFYWLWKLLFDTLPKNPNILEIGVYRGQTLALFRTLSPKSHITGITPLDTTGDFHVSDYGKDITELHILFKLKQPEIWEGLSTNPEIISQASIQEWDVIYIDGGHDYETVKSDVFKYSSFVKIGGYLVIDDSANKYTMPDGYFKGIADVSKAVDELLPNEFYTEILSVIHNRIFKRLK